MALDTGATDVADVANADDAGGAAAELAPPAPESAPGILTVTPAAAQADLA